ncbi:MAG: hypothetical protein QOI15_2556, partial [Pseudonocardiales bacterium]|nr:hypothetical protein [Pseudonocardiales bacterium]
MLLLTLLLIALISVILGVIFASVAWLFVSLVASVLAAMVLVRSWRMIKERRTQMARGSKSDKPASKSWLRGRKKDAPPGDAPEPAAAAADPEVVVVDGRPEYHRADCSRLSGVTGEPVPLSQAVEDGFTRCPVCAPFGGPSADEDPAVWVVDGSPQYHEQACRTLDGLEPEPIALSQALEDGFVRCTVCTPPAGASALGIGGPTPSATRQVWVADGFPEYHHEGCVELRGVEAEPIPYDQAVEDGFQPCVVCNPDVEFAAAAPEPEAPAPAAEPVAEAQPESVTPAPAPEAEPEPAFEDEPAFEPEPVGVGSLPAEVWVADGYPLFHSAGCHELNGLDSEPVPLDQAVEDGFEPCPVCAPVGAVPAAEPGAAPVEAADVWVVDGFPDYHREVCRELVGLAAEPVPHEQAVEDGFTACVVCAPDAATAPAEPEPEPEPAQPEPEPEPEPEPAPV